MFDIGVNLDHPSFLTSLKDFEQQFQAKGVEGIICIASTMSEADSLQTHCREYNSMHYTIGCHPHHASTWCEDHKELMMQRFADDPKAVAVGEMGLDYNRNYSSPEDQRKAFAAQLGIANVVQKPVYLHERDAFEDMLSMLQAQPPARGVIHCFTGEPLVMKEYLDLGLYVGITGWLLDERRNEALVASVKQLPLERLLLETDAPYLLPRTIRPRPKRNHPQYLPYIAKAVAEIKGLSIDEVVAHTRANTQALFFS